MITFLNYAIQFIGCNIMPIEGSLMINNVWKISADHSRANKHSPAPILGPFYSKHTLKQLISGES